MMSSNSLGHSSLAVSDQGIVLRPPYSQPLSQKSVRARMLVRACVRACKRMCRVRRLDNSVYQAALSRPMLVYTQCIAHDVEPICLHLRSYITKYI